MPSVSGLDVKHQDHEKPERFQNLSVCLRGAAHREQHRDGGLSSGPHRRRGRRAALLRGAVVPARWLDLRTGAVSPYHQQTLS